MHADLPLSMLQAPWAATASEHAACSASAALSGGVDSHPGGGPYALATPMSALSNHQVSMGRKPTYTCTSQLHAAAEALHCFQQPPDPALGPVAGMADHGPHNVPCCARQYGGTHMPHEVTLHTCMQTRGILKVWSPRGVHKVRIPRQRCTCPCCNSGPHCNIDVVTDGGHASASALSLVSPRPHQGSDHQCKYRAACGWAVCGSQCEQQGHCLLRPVPPAYPMNQTTLDYVSRTLLVRCLSNLHQATTPSVPKVCNRGLLLHSNSPCT